MNEEQKLKIILVEDDPFLASMYVSKLETANYEIMSEEDGKKGYELIAKEKPDLVLLDILLPGMDGFEVLKKLKDNEELKNIPVILLTNLGQKNDVEKGLDLGADDYLIKAHFTPSEVIEKIKKAVNNKKQ